MPRESRRRLRGLLGSYLVGSAFVAASCRIGYDEVGSTGGAGFAGSGAQAGSGSMGGSTGAGAASGAGESALGGASDLPIGGSAANGGSSSSGGDSSAAGAGGNAGSAATGGAGGDGPTPPGCTDTTDCSCASNEGHAYWFCSGALDWEGAEAHCETQAMQLVRIDSQQENDFLVSSGASSGVFALNGFAQIGANDRAVAGEWRWIDGELFWQGGPTGAAVGGAFSNWLASSPSASGVQQCSGLLDTGEWQVRSCTAVVPFICEGS